MINCRIFSGEKCSGICCIKNGACLFKTRIASYGKGEFAAAHTVNDKSICAMYREYHSKVLRLMALDYCFSLFQEHTQKPPTTKV